MIQKKTSYQLPKVKKQWVTLAGTATLLSMTLASAGLAQADEQASSNAANSTGVIRADSAAVVTKPQAVSTQVQEQAPSPSQQAQSEASASPAESGQQNWTAVDQGSQPSSYAPASSQATSAIRQGAETASTRSQASEAAPGKRASSATVQTAPAQDGWVTDPDTGQTYYYQNGQKVIDSSLRDGDKLYHLNQETGALIKNTWYLQNNSPSLSQWFYLGADGLPLTGHQTIAGQAYYFYPSGVQSKGEFLKDQEGKLIKTDADTGVVTSNFAPNRFYTAGNNKWYYIDEKGELASGWKTINGQKLYFSPYDNVQAKGSLTTTEDGKAYYFDQDTGDVWTNRFVQVPTYDYRGIRPGGQTGYAWVYLTADGSAASGLTQTPEGQTLFFNSYDHHQVKGRLVNTDGNNYRYFDVNTGDMWRNRTYTEAGVTYQIDADGIARKV